MRVIDGISTLRGMVRTHTALIGDIAFHALRGQTLLASVSLDGRLSVAHVQPPDTAAPPVATGKAPEVVATEVLSLQLSGAYGPAGVATGAYRPRLAWRPGRAELLVATGAHVLRVDTVQVMPQPG